MRTTLDLPDDLFRKAKATAALRGMKLKDLFKILIEDGLRNKPAQNEYGHKEPPPVSINLPGAKIPALTNAEIFEILDREDDQQHGRLT